MAPRARGILSPDQQPGTSPADLLHSGAPVGFAEGPRPLWRCEGRVPTKDGSNDSQVPGTEAYARYRLAVLLQHFLPGVPVTWYGDEVGMFGADEPCNVAPMWWPDLNDPKTKSPYYRGDLFGLVQWLHTFRVDHRPLRAGLYRALMLDEDRRVLAFARSLPGDEVVLVMNYGNKKQKVMLPVGRPGQLVAVITPHLEGRSFSFGRSSARETPDRSKPVRQAFSGSRQFVNDLGQVRVWVDPMSVRIILVNDNEPKR